MAAGGTERRLGAVLAADVVGYTRLMHVDETGTHLRLKELRDQVIGPQFRVHGGRIVKGTGDGVLGEFPRALEALACAVGIQRQTEQRNRHVPPDGTIAFRIGLNVGDLIIETDDIYGDGVNIAVRLEGLAPPGGICASRAFLDMVEGKVQLPFADLGEQNLKNIASPIRTYSLSAAAIAALPEDEIVPQSIIGPRSRPSLAITRASRLSIAVMPFADLSGSGSQDYFADGIVEDIIAALSRFRTLFVIARDSSLTYKGRNVDPQQVARELGVRYLVEGSIQCAQERIRINAALVEPESRGQLWADHVEGSTSDIFALQDRVAVRVVTAIEPKVLASEIERAKRKPTESLDAYDYYLRALPLRLALSADATDRALELLLKAIELDPSYAPALAHASACYLARHDQGWKKLTQEEIEEGLRLARAAIDADMDDPVALCIAGHTISSLTGEYEAGLAWIERALYLNPSYAEGWMRSSMVRIYLDQLDIAIEHAARAIELSPMDLKLYHPLCAQGYAYLLKDQPEEAAARARRALNGRQKPEMAFRILLTALAAMRRGKEMEETAASLMRHIPGFRISAWRQRSTFTRDPRFDIMEAALRQAGLPE